MCKSALYAANTGTQAITAGSPISFGSIVRRYGGYLNLSGGNVVTEGAGYYEAIVNLTFVADTAGEVNVSMYSDGVEVPGATVSVPGTAGIEYAVTIPAIIKQKCYCDTYITVKPDANITLTNAAISVKKI